MRPSHWRWNVFQETDSRYGVVSEGIAIAIVDAESSALISGDGLPTKIITGKIAILVPFDAAIAGVVIRTSIFHREWDKIKTSWRSWRQFLAFLGFEKTIFTNYLPILTDVVIGRELGAFFF